jgi:hypothetical protein
MEAALAISVTKTLTWNYCEPGIHSGRQRDRLRAAIKLLQKPFASKTMYTASTRQRRHAPRRCAHEICSDSDGHGLYPIREWAPGFRPDFDWGTEKANSGGRRRQAKFTRAAREQDGFHPCRENKSAGPAREQAGSRRCRIAQAPEVRRGRLCPERFAAAQIANKARKPPMFGLARPNFPRRFLLEC